MRAFYIDDQLVNQYDLIVGDEMRIVEDGVQYIDEEGCDRWHITDVEGDVLEVTSLMGYKRYLC